MKKCTKCKKDKTIDNFSADPRLKNGKRSHCKQCDHERYIRYYKGTNGKKCQMCLKFKELNLFYNNKGCKDGKVAICVSCHKKRRNQKNQGQTSIH